MKIGQPRVRRLVQAHQLERFGFVGVILLQETKGGIDFLVTEREPIEPDQQRNAPRR